MPGRNRFALLGVQRRSDSKGGRRSHYMSQTKQAPKRKRKALSVSVLSVAGMSLAATTTGSEAAMPSPATAPVQAFALGEEEISDVTLATFHLFDKQTIDQSRSLLHLTRCGCGCGGGGCHGCGGCRCGFGGGCRCGFGGCRCGFGGCRIGGCGCGGCGCWGCGGGGCCITWGGCIPWC
jgi:hypothetical protein